MDEELPPVADGRFPYVFAGLVEREKVIYPDLERYEPTI
jgi:hypothetical protein